MNAPHASDEILPRGVADLDYDQGLVDGWDHAVAVLTARSSAFIPPNETALIRHKRIKVAKARGLLGRVE